MTHRDISRRIKSSCAIIVLATFCAGLETGYRSRSGIVRDEQAEAAIDAAIHSTIFSKANGDFDEYAKREARKVALRTLSTEKTNLPYKGEE